MLAALKGLTRGSASNPIIIIIIITIIITIVRTAHAHLKLYSFFFFFFFFFIFFFFLYHIHTQHTCMNMIITSCSHKKQQLEPHHTAIKHKS